MEQLTAVISRKLGLTHGNQLFSIKFEAGKFSVVKHSHFAKICENHKSFSPRMFCRIRYMATSKVMFAGNIYTFMLIKLLTHSK